MIPDDDNDEEEISPKDRLADGSNISPRDRVQVGSFFSTGMIVINACRHGVKVCFEFRVSEDEMVRRPV